MKIKNIKLTKEIIINHLKNNGLVLLGTFVLAIGTELFILPSSLNTGGVSGIAIIFKFLGFKMSSELIITICTYSLFVLGLIFLGINFSYSTMLSTIFYSLFLFLLKYLIKVLPFLSIENSPIIANDKAMMSLISSLFGGIFVGAGCGITFLGGGSTGGVDIITFIICKYFKKVKSSICVFLIDALIVFLGFIFNPTHDLVLCLLGVLSAFIAAIMIDKVFVGSNRSYVANIVTEKWKEITDKIIDEMDRTTSIVDIVGGYSMEEKKMLIVSFNIKQYASLRRIISLIDKKAFMTISQAHEINGEGFKPIE